MAKILLVDDEPALRQTVRRMLVSFGHVVTEAGDGKQALQLLETEMPDLVICDIVMPEREGIETIMTIRKLYPTMGILAISGSGVSSDLDYLDLARKLGADASLAKPFRSAELRIAVDRLLSPSTSAENGAEP